ncbi:MAG TPA: hypothetical protein VEV17_18805 [Bryobacteraceae bacterium]|nr:hypothetical protein [Bryobacteraceae bacterium]
MNLVALLAQTSAVILMAQSEPVAKDTARTPTFRDYPATEVFTGEAVDAILTTAEERRYRTRIREGVSKGRGVWNGSWKHPVESPGPNFAGHYYVIRWGCGSECLMMAVVDAISGRVFGSPLNGSGTELYVSMDPLSDVKIDFRRDSSLMVLRNGCAGARKECGVYYFDWRNDASDSLSALSLT